MLKVNKENVIMSLEFDGGMYLIVGDYVEELEGWIVSIDEVGGGVYRISLRDGEEGWWEYVNEEGVFKNNI